MGNKNVLLKYLHLTFRGRCSSLVALAIGDTLERKMIMVTVVSPEVTMSDV